MLELFEKLRACLVRLRFLKNSSGSDSSDGMASLVEMELF